MVRLDRRIAFIGRIFSTALGRSWRKQMPTKLQRISARGSQRTLWLIRTTSVTLTSRTVTWKSFDDMIAFFVLSELWHTNTRTHLNCMRIRYTFHLPENNAFITNYSNSISRCRDCNSFLHSVEAVSNLATPKYTTTHCTILVTNARFRWIVK